MDGVAGGGGVVCMTSYVFTTLISYGHVSAAHQATPGHVKNTELGLP